MNKIKFSLLVIVAALLAGNALFAQSVEQGKKFYYYQRYKSAKEVFDKILASNSNNVDAIYWLGETMIDNKDSASARTLLQKALVANPNAPLVLVGMGHIELLDGKIPEARQHFETAISLTKGKDVNVLNAIGKANAQARNGDASYAVEKLLQATQTRNFNSADTYIYMGDAYRKLVDGGGAVKSYISAMQKEPTMAEPKYKIGMIYRTQNNPETYLSYFREALQADSTYAPALYEMYYYYYNIDINKAAEYFDKYLANSDHKPSDEYDRISIIYARKAFNDAINAAKQKIAAESNADPRYYKLIAYSYDALHDSVSAKNFLDQYFSKQKPEGFVPKDYSFKGYLLAKIPGTDSAEVFRYYQMAVDKDTAVDEKIKTLKEAMDMAKKKANKPAIAQFAGELYVLNPDPTNTDLYNWGYANYSASNYKTADSIFCGVYESKYPNEIYGYLWCAKSKQAQDDSIGSQGLAVDAYKKLAEVARSLDSTAKAAGTADSVKYRSQAVQSYFFLASHYNDIKKDKQSAIYYLEQVLLVDPNNASAPRFIKMLADSGKKETGSAGSRPAGQATRTEGARTGAAKK